MFTFWFWVFGLLLKKIHYLKYRERHTLVNVGNVRLNYQKAELYVPSWPHFVPLLHIGLDTLCLASHNAFLYSRILDSNKHNVNHLSLSMFDRVTSGSNGIMLHKCMYMFTESGMWRQIKYFRSFMWPQRRFKYSCNAFQAASGGLRTDAYRDFKKIRWIGAK